jgi:uncharacterized protein YhbP (UPF0306 family)
MSSKSRILKSALSILKDNELLTLATVDEDQPCACTAYYAFDGRFNLYLWTGKDTHHVNNIKADARVAVNIFDSHQKWGSFLRGMQAFGTASTVNDIELVKAGLLYMRRYPKVIKFVKSPRDFHAKLFGSRLYKIRLERIKVLDEKTFGKEVWKTMRI